MGVDPLIEVERLGQIGVQPLRFHVFEVCAAGASLLFRHDPDGEQISISPIGVDLIRFQHHLLHVDGSLTEIGTSAACIRLRLRPRKTYAEPWSAAAFHR